MSRALKDVLDESNPNKLPAAAQSALLGSGLALVPRFVQGAVASDVLELPEGAKAAQVLNAYARAGSSTGYKLPVASHTTPGAGEVAVDPDGNIVFNGTDAVTSAEVVYVSVDGEIKEEEVDVAAAGGASPLQSREALVLLEAELLSGSSTGVKTVVARGSSPSAGEAAVADDGTIAFNGTDVGASTERARIKYIARPGAGEGVENAFGDRLDGSVQF